MRDETVETKGDRRRRLNREAKRRQRERGLQVPTQAQRVRSKAKRRALGLCNDCAEPALHSAARCEKCAEAHRKRERLALKYGRPDYLAHLHEELPLWQRALLARGQVRKSDGRFIAILREKKAS